MKKNQGFTLIELLVVITIIGILMGILLPAVGAAFKKAKEARANTEVRAIETAMKAYLQEYGKFPLQVSSTDDQEYNTGKNAPYPAHKDLISILRGQNSKDKLNKNTNPRSILFLEVSEDSLVDGEMQDPWEQVYRITADWDFDNIVNSHTGRNVVVWSDGNTNIATWK